MDTQYPITPAPLRAPEFSLVLGGPMYQLLRRSRLSDDALTLVHRRILAFAAVTWLPLLLLSIWEGRAWSGEIQVPFLNNIEAHARFLLALPILILSELVVHVRMKGVLLHFRARHLVSAADEPRVDAIAASAMRLRNSMTAELLLIVIVFGAGIPLRNYLAVDASSWATITPVAAGESTFAALSLAGWWHALVSLPLFQFVLIRWYFRLLIWIRFLWQVSRLQLQLMPSHPDRAGGLGFLSNIVYAFTPFLAAHGVLLSALIAERILFGGAKLQQFTVEIIGGVAMLVFLVLCPLLVFAGQLARAKRAGLGAYGIFAQRYVREFDAKWMRGGAAPAEPLVGSADIQSLADLGNSFDVVRTMRIVPFTKETVFQLGLVTLAPLLPLTLTMLSLEELLKRLLSAVF